MAKTPFNKTEVYIKSALRKIWRWSKNRRECLKATECAEGKGHTKPFVADHIDPVVDPKKGWQGWDVYIDRMFNGKLQALCKPCHRKKTKLENAERRKANAKV